MRLVTVAALSGVLLLGSIHGLLAQNQTSPTPTSPGGTTAPPPPPPPPGDTTSSPPPAPSIATPPPLTTQQPPPPSSQPQPPLQPAPPPPPPSTNSQPGYQPPPPPNSSTSPSSSVAPPPAPTGSATAPGTAAPVVGAKTMYAAKIVNLRATPDAKGAKVGALQVGQQVSVVRSVNPEWVEVMHNNKVAYAFASLLTDQPVAAAKPSARPANATAPSPVVAQPVAATKPSEQKMMEANGSNGNRVWVYNSPDCSFRTTAFFVHEEKVRVVKKANDKFWEVLNRDDKAGYVATDDLKPVGSGAVTKRIRDYCQQND